MLRYPAIGSRALSVDKIKKILCFCILVCFLSFTPKALAVTSSEVGFLIIDKTKTPWGHKFYHIFSELWKPPEGIKGYFIKIGEIKPSIRQSWIYVDVGDNIYMTRVYLRLLKPSTSDFDMQSYALEAIKRVYTYLLTRFQQLKFMEEHM